MNNKGFTLIELLVIIFIIGTMSTIVLVNYSASGDKFLLERTAQKISQDIRLTQQKSLSAVDGGVDTNGYGVCFDINNNNYFVYKNNNTNYYYDTGDETIETIELPDEIVIESIKNNLETVSSISISFIPPEPLTYIENDMIGREAFIAITLIEDETEKRIIQVNNSGRIEIIKYE